MVSLLAYLKSTTFTPSLLPLPPFYTLSCLPYQLVGLSIALSSFTEPLGLLEAIAWVGVGFTSHYADVTMFAQPGWNVVIDSVLAPSCLILTLRRLGFRRAVNCTAVCLFYYLRGQMSEEGDTKKIYDHSMWHWTGQCFRLMELIWKTSPVIVIKGAPKGVGRIWETASYEICQVAVYCAILFAMERMRGLGGGLWVEVVLVIWLGVNVVRRDGGIGNKEKEVEGKRKKVKEVGGGVRKSARKRTTSVGKRRTRSSSSRKRLTEQ